MRSRLRYVAFGLGVGWAVAILVTLTQIGNPVDAWCYYGFDQSNPWDLNFCFLYSPPVEMVMTAIRSVMPFELFVFLLRTAELIVLVVVAGPAVGLALFIPAVAIELNAVNINLLLVGAVLIGFRYPAVWAFIALTKVTPAVGMLWFAARREWRNFAFAAGTTVVIAAASWILAPETWNQYLATLRGAPDISIWRIEWRLPLAAIVVIWGARKDHRWAVIVAVFLALPRWYYLSPVVLVGLFPLVRFAHPLPWPNWIRRRFPSAEPAVTTPAIGDGQTTVVPPT